MSDRLPIDQVFFSHPTRQGKNNYPNYPLGETVIIPLIRGQISSIKPIEKITMINHNLPTKRERLIASLCHLSPVIPLFIILLCNLTGIGSAWSKLLFFSRLVFPIICWNIGRNNHWIINHAKISLNFQITQTFILLSPSIISSVLISGNPVAANPGFFGIMFLVFVIQLAVILVHLMLAVKAAMIAQNNLDDTGQLIYPANYPLTIPFFRTPKPSSQLIELPEKNPNSTLNQGESNANSVVKLLLAVPISLVICFIAFIVSLIVGKIMAGPEVYDNEYDPEGAWRHANDGIGIIATTLSHLYFWLGLVFINKYLNQTNIFLAAMISMPYLVLLFGSWWIVIFLIFYPNG